MRRMVLVAVAAATIVPMAAQAEGMCRVALGEASAETPHATDPTNDWEGLVLGNGAAIVPAGDLYREGTDLTAVWLDNSADPGYGAQANLKVADLGVGVQPNAIFYALWNYGEGPQAARWASARFKPGSITFTYGYKTVNPVTGNPLFATVGETTGSVDVESDTISINLGTAASGHTSPWMPSEAGAEVTGITAESRILVGSPEPLPSNPTGLRHGNVYLADVVEETCMAIA